MSNGVLPKSVRGFPLVAILRTIGSDTNRAFAPAYRSQSIHLLCWRRKSLRMESRSRKPLARAGACRPTMDAIEERRGLVLVVDDDEIIHAVLDMALRTAGHDAVVAGPLASSN